MASSGRKATLVLGPRARRTWTANTVIGTEGIQRLIWSPSDPESNNSIQCRKSRECARTADDEHTSWKNLQT